MNSSFPSQSIGFNPTIQQILSKQVASKSNALNSDVVSIQKPQFSGRPRLPDLKSEEIDTIYQHCFTVIPKLDLMAKKSKKTHLEGNFFYKLINTDKEKLVYKVFKSDALCQPLSQPIALTIWKDANQALPTLDRINKVIQQQEEKKQVIKDVAQYFHFNYLENTPHLFVLTEYINKDTKKLKQREGKLAKEQNIRFHQGFWNSIGYFFSPGKKKGIQYRYKKLFVNGLEYPPPAVKPSKKQLIAKTEDKKDP